MKIAFMGLKGMPPKFGGLQFDAEQIGKRLVERGHEVYVYSRKWYSGKNTHYYKGMNLVFTPTVSLRYTDIFVHSFTSALHVLWRNYDIVHFFSFGSYFYVPLLRLFGKKTVITMGGEPWTDITYTSLGRLLAWWAYKIGIRFADVVTSESLPLKEEIEKTYARPVTLTPVGAFTKQGIEPQLIRSKLNLQGDGYILFLGRLAKVKRVDWLIKAYKEAEISPLKLVIAGDIKDYSYRNHLYEVAKGYDNIIFTGFVKGRLKEELLSNCLLFVLPSVSEGMPTALMEAMSYGRPCLVSDIAPHRWLVQDHKTGFLFNVDSLPDFVTKLRAIHVLPKESCLEMGNRAREYIRKTFSWDSTTEVLEKVYMQLLEKC